MALQEITIDHVSVAYQHVVALSNIHGCFGKGSLTAVVGPNGAGKSTLVKAIVGLLAPTSGAISGPRLSRQTIAYLPQAAEIDRSFPITVQDTVTLGSWRCTGAFRAVPRAMLEAADHALATVGLQGFGTRQIGSLSVGQFQRVLFARLLLQDTPTIILDEPFAAVDSRTTGDLMTIVGKWYQDGRTVIAVLHNLDTVRAHFPQTLLLARQQVAWGPTDDVLTVPHLAQARQLLEAEADGFDASSREAAE